MHNTYAKGARGGYSMSHFHHSWHDIVKFHAEYDEENQWHWITMRDDSGNSHHFTIHMKEEEE